MSLTSSTSVGTHAIRQHVVTAAHWDARRGPMDCDPESGQQAKSRLSVHRHRHTLSAHTLPTIPWRDRCFSAPPITPARKWPHTPVDFTDKTRRHHRHRSDRHTGHPRDRRCRAKQLATVFQRRPNHSRAATQINAKISKEEMERIKSRYDEIYAHCATTAMWFIHQADPRKTMPAEVPAEEREAFWEKRVRRTSASASGWAISAIPMGLTRKPSRAISDFIARKIRQRVKGPEGGGAAIPKDHGFGTRRAPPLESGYCFLEACYNL